MSQTSTPIVAHTPGPWIVDARPGDLQIIGRSTADGAPLWLAEVWSGEANARLIAAAPELYETVKKMLAAPADEWPLFGDDLHRAIAKATGR